MMAGLSLDKYVLQGSLPMQLLLGIVAVSCVKRYRDNLAGLFSWHMAYSLFKNLQSNRMFVFMGGGQHLSKRMMVKTQKSGNRSQKTKERDFARTLLCICLA